MNYWDIRKRKRLHHLPAPDPELSRAGVNDSDRRFLQSREWIKLYHAEKAQQERPQDVKITQESSGDRLMAHADASSEDGTAGRSEGDARAGLEFAPR